MPEKAKTGERWVTMNGARVLIGGKGEVKAGLGGKQAPPKAGNEQKNSTPQEHVSGAKAHQAAEAVHLDAKQKDAIKNYTGALFRTMNPALRKGGKVPSGDRKDLAEMDRAFSGASVKAPITVYRGVSGDVASKLVKGATFEDGAFVSTSSDKKAASNFVRGDGAALMEIRVPKGAKAISVKDISQFGKSEQEILLNRGGKFKVVEVKKGKQWWQPTTIIVEMAA